MKKENVLLVILIIVFAQSVYGEFIGPGVAASKTDNQNTAKVVYTDEYRESVRQDVIQELYGSRETYASEKTGSRADYLDKEASKGGEMVIDEKRMQQVYDSKLQEYDARIDNEKVDKIVNERLEQVVDEGRYDDLAESNEVTSKDVMYWKNGGKYFALVVEALMILFILYRKIKAN